jgi:sugar O-acyltransferase (sialic acid O-acetyltransferase NeuD family)
MPIVVYGIGSPIVLDVAETCLRLRLPVAAWVRNVEAPAFAPIGGNIVAAADITDELLQHDFLVPLFTPGNRRSAVDDATRRGFKNPATVIDPTAIVASSAAVGRGSYVNSMANVGAASRIGAFSFINRGASVGHHVELSDFVSIGPAAVIAGGARIERGAVIGAGAVVLPERHIGANAVVGAGAVVTRPVPPNTMVAGNPARVVRTELPAYNADRGAGS